MGNLTGLKHEREQFSKKVKRQTVHLTVQMIRFAANLAPGSRLRRVMRNKGAAKVVHFAYAEEIRILQRCNLRLLKIFDLICRENGIRWWLDFGSCLGAVRHRGFIPWDDDIDLGMLRPDYDRLTAVLDRALAGSDLYWDRGRPTDIIRICHRKIPCQIDIFPYQLYAKSVMSDEEKRELQSRIGACREELKKRERAGLSLPVAEVTSEKIMQNQNALTEEDHPVLFWGLDFFHPWNDWIRDYDAVFPLVDLPFDDDIFPCPRLAADHLARIYGKDFMVPQKFNVHYDDRNFPGWERAVATFLQEDQQ